MRDEFLTKIVNVKWIFDGKDKIPDDFLCKRERNTFIKLEKRQPMT